MSGLRRTAVLLGCSAVLGSLAAADVGRQQARVNAAIGVPVPVVVATRELRAGDRLDARVLGVREVPARYAPRLRYENPAALAGLRAATAIPKGADLQRAMVDDGSRQGAPVRAGERVAQLTALGAAEMIVPGVHVDVIVTSDRGGGTAEVALQDAEVLSARPVTGEDAGAPKRVEVALRVRAAQVQMLARAEDYAHAVRVVPRAVDDRQRLRNP